MKSAQISQSELELSLPTAWTVEADRAAVPEDSWWKSFGDPRLEALVEEALSNNQDLRVTAARVQAALADARIAHGNVFPQIDVGLGGNRQRRNFIGFPIPGAPAQVLSTTSTNYGLSLNLNWEVDLWGRLGAAVAAARADVEALEGDLEASRLSLAAQTGKAWFAVIEARQQVDLAEETLENREANVELVRRRFQVGIKTALDLRLARSARELSRSILEVRRAQLDGAKRSLELLLGRYPAAQIEAVGDLETFRAAIPAGLPADLLRRRPDLRAAERRILASGARVDEARAALLPQFSLTTSVGTASNQLRDLLRGDFSVWSLAGNLLAPLFQGGRLWAGVDRARAGMEEDTALYAQQALQAFFEVETALAQEGFLSRRQAALEAASRDSLAAESLAQERYRSGLVDYLFVLESQREAFSTQSQLLEVRRQRIDVRIDLHLALGGGFTSAEPSPPAGASS